MAGHYAEWNKPVTTRHMLCESTYISFLMSENQTQRQTEEWWFPESGGSWGDGELFNGYRISDEKGYGDRLYNSVNVLNTTELYIWKWFKMVNFICAWLRAKLLRSYPTLCNPMDCSPPGSSFHGILQARILELAAMPSSRGSFWLRDRTRVSYVSCIGRQVLYR